MGLTLNQSKYVYPQKEADRVQVRGVCNRAVAKTYASRKLIVEIETSLWKVM